MYQVNFSSWRMDRQLARYRFWRNLGLCQALFFIIVLVVVQRQSHLGQISQQSSLAALLHQQKVLNQHHQQVQQRVTQKQHAEQRVKMYRQMHQSAHRYATLLQLLAQEVPDNCWLISLIPKDEHLIFEAVSQDYAAIHDFLVKLRRQSLLANVRLQKIAQQDDGYFRFTAQASWQEKDVYYDE
ncbi:PilN domain-containing protein [Yersinia kristensenii]|uniref:PilN domain-containing protein n=1 Tax=Yersinia kristensenii TaxID=28152 RepID=UPI0005E3C754|nr:PilN domain-containing protein [Yersinia kristensenii]CNG94487.1 type IV pilus biogenesis protein PilN [Yersinia kristensenii]CNJ83544.1 type IV pilus biogenesis protein PilN [Yersinia kristensenii]